MQGLGGGSPRRQRAALWIYPFTLELDTHSDVAWVVSDNGPETREGRASEILYAS